MGARKGIIWFGYAYSSRTLGIIMISVNGEYGDANIEIGVFVVDCRKAARREIKIKDGKTKQTPTSIHLLFLLRGH